MVTDPPGYVFLFSTLNLPSLNHIGRTPGLHLLRRITKKQRFKNIIFDSSLQNIYVHNKENGIEAQGPFLGIKGWSIIYTLVSLVFLIFQKTSTNHTS